MCLFVRQMLLIRAHICSYNYVCLQVRQVGVLMLRRLVGCLKPQECKQVGELALR